MIVTTDVALKMLEDAVAARGVDFNYKEWSMENFGDQMCEYTKGVIPGDVSHVVPGCIIGLALNLNGISLDRLVYVSGVVGGTHTCNRLGMDDPGEAAREILLWAQLVQDGTVGVGGFGGKTYPLTWGHALNAARACYDLIQSGKIDVSRHLTVACSV